MTGLSDVIVYPSPKRLAGRSSQVFKGSVSRCKVTASSFLSLSNTVTHCPRQPAQIADVCVQDSVAEPYVNINNNSYMEMKHSVSVL